MRAIRAFYYWCLFVFICSQSLMANAEVEPGLFTNPKAHYAQGQWIGDEDNPPIVDQKAFNGFSMACETGNPASSYKNIAFADSDEGNKISNDGSAVITFSGDKLFDTASIIGKVFEDHNGNGYQSDATAKNIRVWVDIPMGDYVPESTVLKYDKEWKPQADRDAIVFYQGIDIPELWGESYQPHGKPQSATVIYKSHKGLNYPVTVTSKTGSEIKFKRNGAVSKKVRGNLAKGLNSEDLHVTTKVFKDSGAFLHEIEIANKGKYDEGIPGVRLITAEGFKLETDEHGRFYVPDRWVLDNKGSNLLIKVDTDSLPARMQVISENPKVLRISPNKLNKFNFGVQRH